MESGRIGRRYGVREEGKGQKRGRQGGVLARVSCECFCEERRKVGGTKNKNEKADAVGNVVKMWFE